MPVDIYNIYATGCIQFGQFVSQILLCIQKNVSRSVLAYPRASIPISSHLIPLLRPQEFSPVNAFNHDLLTLKISPQRRVKHALRIWCACPGLSLLIAGLIRPVVTSLAFIRLTAFVSEMDAPLQVNI